MWRELSGMTSCMLVLSFGVGLMCLGGMLAHLKKLKQKLLFVVKNLVASPLLQSEQYSR